MRIRITFVLLLLMAALAACGGGVPAPTAPSQPPAQSTPATAPTNTAQPAILSNTPAATPAPTPDIEKILNPQPEDWARGPQTAKVTIIEWGDFQ